MVVDVVDSDRTYRFDADVDTVWAAMCRVDEFPAWWPWLRDFDAGGVETGARWQCTVRPPVPYALRFEIALTEVVVAERIVAAVSGDIAGDASLTIQPVGDVTEVRLVSSLAPRRTVLRQVTTLAPWLARFGHDWVLDTGLRQFRRRAL